MTEGGSNEGPTGVGLDENLGQMWLRRGNCGELDDSASVRRSRRRNAFGKV